MAQKCRRRGSHSPERWLNSLRNIHLVPNEVFQGLKELKIDVRIVDTKGTVLSKSNEVILKVDSSSHNSPQIKWAEPGDIKVSTKFNISNSSNESILGIVGSGFTKSSKIFINDMAMDTEYKTSEYISCVVPDNLYSQPTVFNIEVRNTSVSSTHASNKIKIYVTN